MTTDAVDQGESPISPEIRHGNERLENRLNSWVAERTNPGERKARARIANAAIKDTEGSGGGLSKESVIKLTRSMKRKIDKLISEDQGEFVFRDKSDSITGEKYDVKFRKEAGGVYVVEEVSSAQRVISQARIHPDGNTELTLDFTGSRYEDVEKGIDRNPRIIVDSNFPRACVEVFNLLAKYN